MPCRRTRQQQRNKCFSLYSPQLPPEKGTIPLQSTAILFQKGTEIQRSKINQNALRTLPNNILPGRRCLIQPHNTKINFYKLSPFKNEIKPKQGRCMKQISEQSRRKRREFTYCAHFVMANSTWRKNKTKHGTDD